MRSVLRTLRAVDATLLLDWHVKERDERKDGRKKAGISLGRHFIAMGVFSAQAHFSWMKRLWSHSRPPPFLTHSQYGTTRLLPPATNRHLATPAGVSIGDADFGKRMLQE
jgi:hypothetical protein